MSARRRAWCALVPCFLIAVAAMWVGGFVTFVAVTATFIGTQAAIIVTSERGEA